MRGDDDEDDEEDEFGLMVKSSIPNANGSIAEVPMNGSVHQSISRRGSRASQSDVPMPVEEVREKTWKRVTDPRGLPEQDASVFVKARKTLKEDIIHNKDLLHKYSQRLFDDRMYIIDENDPGYKAGGELALNQAIGVNKYKSPIVAKVAEYVAPGLEMLKVGLSVWRAGFNLFMWKDPFLTSIFFFGAIFLLLLLLVFPWRMFFFAMGFGAVGPQVSFNCFLILNATFVACHSPNEITETCFPKNEELGGPSCRFASKEKEKAYTTKSGKVKEEEDTKEKSK